MSEPADDEVDSLRAHVAELEAAAERLRDAYAGLERQYALNRAIVAGAPVGLGMADESGAFVVWNDAMLSFSGFTPAEEAAWKESREQPEARASRARMLEVVRQQGGLYGHEFPIPQLDGSTGLAIATVKPVELAGQRFVHVTLQDVTRHKRIEGELQETELRFRQVAETIRHVFYITTSDFAEVLYVSPAYESQWGRTSESLYAQPRSWMEAIHAEDRAQVLERLAAGSVDGVYELEYRIVRPDGSIRWILDRAYELRDAQGQRYRNVGVAEDVTDRRRLSEQLREAQKMEAVGQLAGGVAHDFNNLITVILGNVMLLGRAMAPDASQQALLEEVEHAAFRAGDLTRKLLGFSRRTTLDLTALDLRDTVRETVGLLRRTLDPRIHIVIDEAVTLGRVLADAGALSQVVLNLCLNARDAMPEGGTLRVRTRSMHVSDEHAARHIDARSGDAVCLSVEDTGMGIAPELRGHIFEPFFTTKEPGAGTGLGLAMVFGTIKQHRGWIEFDSEVGRGTRFDVYLPAYQGASLEPLKSPSSARRACAGETILFVDDEAGIRNIAASMLGEQGYEVLLAEDGQAAIDVFEQQWRSIDLVILDLRMPRLSGRDTLHAIWRIDPHARVLVTSGHSDDYQRVVDTEPVAGCLPKPWTLDELADAMASALGREAR